MENKDELGRRRDCHFCVTGSRKIFCSVLKEFYNIDKDGFDLCGKCPFYKTDKEFLEGWSKRKPIDEKMVS